MGVRISGDANLWPFGVIPYEINAQNFPDGSPDRAEILAGIEILNTRTNLTMVPRSTEEDYVEFVFSEKACKSHVGRGRGRQEVSCAIDLAGFNAERSVVHECLHAAGFYHEHQREDRDDFITVDFDNIIEDRKRPDFKKKEDADVVGPYDHFSVMHYPRTGGFAKDPTKDVITPKDATIDPDKVGGKQLSAADVEVISTVYPFKAVPGWFGAESRGADIAVGAILPPALRKNSKSTDLVVAWVNVGRERDSLHYRVGWEMDGAARPQGGWSDCIDVPALPDRTWRVEGVGAALADIDGNGRLDLLITYIQRIWRPPPSAALFLPLYDLKAFYRVGFNLNADGVASTWSAPFAIPGDIPSFGEGQDPGEEDVVGHRTAVGLALADIDSNGQQDMIFFHARPLRGSDFGFYRVGFNLGVGGAANRWSEEFAIPAPLDARTNGAGVAVADVGGFGRPYLLMYQVSNPNGPNRALYWIGNDMLPTGEIDPAGPWSPRIPLPGLLGPRSQGGGFAAVELHGRQHLLYFFLDNPVPGQNRGVYRAVPWNPQNPGIAGTFATDDPGDIIEYVVEPDAVAPDMVEFKLELGPNINWHKGVGVPDGAGGENWIEAHDDVRSKSSVSRPAAAVLGRGLSIRFEKAMFLGVITGVGSKPLSDFPSLSPGSRITFIWLREGDIFVGEAPPA
jgi:hypothetical protein